MKIERSISTGPRRSTQQTCADIANLVTGILRQRSYPEVAEVQSGFERLMPLLRFLLTTRRLAEPAITLATPGLQVDVLVSYDPAFVEDLTVPSLTLLGPLSASDLITIIMNNTEDVAESLRDAAKSASTKGVRFELIGDVKAEPPPAELPQEEATDAAPEAENIPASQEPPEPWATPDDARPDDARPDDARPDDARPDDARPDDGAEPVQHGDTSRQDTSRPPAGEGLEQFASHPDRPDPRDLPAS